MAKRAIFDKKNILVVGGAGFIGSHLCDHLVKTSKVICIDNYISGKVDNIEHLLENPNFIIIKANANQLTDLEKFPELEKFQIKFQGIQEIYNLACPTIRKDFEKNIVSTLLSNSASVYNTLEIARTYQAKYLFASSSAVYGDPLSGQDLLEESYWGFIDFLGPRSCYNEGKRFAESLCMNYGHHFNIPVKIARIFNTYGPRMRLSSGRMIPDFVKTASMNQDMIIYGDGSEVDSYCYVSDMVDGLVKLMDSATVGAVNLGSPEKCSIMEIAKKIIKYTNSSSSIKFQEKLPYLNIPGLANINLAKKELGWFPITSLDEGLNKTVANMLGSKVLSYTSYIDNTK